MDVRMVTEGTEGPEPLLLAIQDGSYGVSDDEWPEARDAFRRGLEAEFGVHFEEGNIGPSVDLPAFITLLQTPTVPLWQLALAGFFLGKPIQDNWQVWRNMARAVRAFFSRPAYLNRQSAAPIAISAVMDELGGLPESIRLLGYGTRHIGDADEPGASLSEIEKGPDTIYLGFVRHVFEIEADGARFRVIIEGKTTTVHSFGQA